MSDRCAVVWMLVVLSLAGCRNGDKAAPADAVWQPARSADLYFTTGTLGYVEPCGCTSTPLGGVQRLATIVRSGDKNRALLDAGGLLFPAEPLDEVTGEQHLAKSRILARAYRSLGVVALNLGGPDLGGGRGLLRELQRDGAMPFVSANVRPVGEGGPSVAQSWLRAVGSIKVGVTGVANPDDFQGVSGVTAIAYIPAVRSEVRSLRKRGAEVVIVLAHMGVGGAKDLAREVSDIDVIIRAPGTPISGTPAAPVRIGQVLVVEAGSQGQRVGRLTLRLGSGAPPRPLPLDDGGYAANKKKALVERQIASLRRQIEGWRGDPSKAESIAAREREIARKQAKSAKSSGGGGVTSGPHAKLEIVPLGAKVAEDPEVSRMLTGYYEQLQKMNLGKGDVSRCKPKVENAPTYVGTAECIDCHEEAHEFWLKTAHAIAWKTLTDAGKQYDLTCIGCHTVGYQQPGGFCRLKDVGELVDVGCENCHGPGSLHAEDGDTDLITLKAPESVCADACHVPDHSDGFNYAKYRAKIIGPGHGGEDSDGGEVKAP